jgi:hypothetical protein
MGYLLFLLVAFAMLGIQLIVTRDGRGEHQHDQP